jgi:hypothetical protein
VKDWICQLVQHGTRQAELSTGSGPVPRFSPLNCRARPDACRFDQLPMQSRSGRSAAAAELTAPDP